MILLDIPKHNLEILSLNVVLIVCCIRWHSSQRCVTVLKKVDVMIRDYNYDHDLIVDYVNDTEIDKEINASTYL